MKFCPFCLKPVVIEEDQTLHGLHQECFIKWFRLSEKQDFTQVSIRESSSGGKIRTEEQFSRINSSVFHGAYKKYSASIGDKNYILKVQDEKYPDLPGIEYLSNQIAKILGISVPDFYFISFLEARPTFVSRNILDSYVGTLDHLYKFIEKNLNQKFTNEIWNCSNIIETIKKETGTLYDVIRFIEVCLFDSLIGNHDRHGRNLAILTLGSSKRKLAPFYDNPSYLGIEEDSLLGADLEPRGAISTENSENPLMKDYVQEFKKFGYIDFVVRFCGKVTSKSSKIVELISNGFISGKRKKAMTVLIEKRLQELENAI